MSKNNETGFYINYDFEYKGYEERDFMYEIPGDMFVEGIREFFREYDINIDGKDNSIWNALLELDALDKIFDDKEEWFKENCKEDAYEAFKEECEEYYYDELDDYVDTDDEEY